MEIISEKYQLNTVSETMNKYFTEDTLFFDIECTGLSPKNSFIYLIGCAQRKGNEITLTQFFATDYDDEKQILIKFEEYLKDFNIVLGYNSTRFDEPFIQTRYQKYGLETRLGKIKHKDMYLTTTKAKCLLNLPNYKQKTLEEFLGLNREDKYNGGELIPVYQSFVETGDLKAKELVLLHNHEDVKGMIHVIDILSYSDLLKCVLTNCNIEDCPDKLRYYFDIDLHLPISINKNRDYGLYIIKDNHVSGSLNKYSGELVTFLDDYKNYFFLLNEGIIIPKSLGTSVDKENKRNATKRDCFVKQENEFVQVPEKLPLPNGVRIFKKDYDSTESYIRLEDLTPEILKTIFMFQLKH